MLAYCTEHYKLTQAQWGNTGDLSGAPAAQSTNRFIKTKLSCQKPQLSHKPSPITFLGQS